MVPKKDQGSGYASERAASQYTSLAMRQGMKAITGQVMSQPGGWEMRQITKFQRITQRHPLAFVTILQWVYGKIKIS